MSDPGVPDPEPEPELDVMQRLGGAIKDPDDEALDAALTHLGGDFAADYGRLGELARWWASVRSPAEPTAPERVLLAGGGADVAARAPGVRALGLPRGGTVDDAIAWGLAEADHAADAGIDLLLLTVDEAEPWRSLTADLLSLDPVEASGWPVERGFSDERWMDEVIVLRDHLRQLRGVRYQPVALLAALGSPAIAAASALLVAATARRTPTLLDGPGAAAVALLVARLNHAASRWWQAAHQGRDRLHERILGSVGLEPLTRLDIGVADGTATVAGLALLDAAVTLLDPFDPFSASNASW